MECGGQAPAKAGVVVAVERADGVMAEHRLVRREPPQRLAEQQLPVALGEDRAAVLRRGGHQQRRRQRRLDDVALRRALGPARGSSAERTSGRGSPAGSRARQRVDRWSSELQGTRERLYVH